MTRCRKSAAEGERSRTRSGTRRREYEENTRKKNPQRSTENSNRSTEPIPPHGRGPRGKTPRTEHSKSPSANEDCRSMNSRTRPDPSERRVVNYTGPSLDLLDQAATGSIYVRARSRGRRKSGPLARNDLPTSAFVHVRDIQPRTRSSPPMTRSRVSGAILTQKSAPFADDLRLLRFAGFPSVRVAHDPPRQETTASVSKSQEIRQRQCSEFTSSCT